MTYLVPFLDLRATYNELRPEIDRAIARVVSSGHYVLGCEVEAFEEEFARAVGAPYCISMGNGLDALTLSLRAMGLRAGDEVLVPTNTFIASWLAISYAGGVPVPVEPEPNTMCVDPLRLHAALSSRTRVVMPVHLYGRPADLAAINDFARQHGLVVLEDAAQAHGARFRGVPVGGHGNTAAWSFYPGKNLGAYGDGGAVTTHDPAIAESLRSLRNYGSVRKYEHTEQGINSRLDEIQAAVLRTKLSRLVEWNSRRRAIAHTYLDALASTNLKLPPSDADAESSWHLFVVRSAQRDRLQEELRRGGVETLIHYPLAPHLQAAYADLHYARGSFPISEQLQQEVLSLPIGPHMSADAVDVTLRVLLKTLAH